MAEPKIKFDIEAEAKGGASVEALAKSLESLGQTLEGDLKTQATAAADALRSLGEKQAAVSNFQQIQNASSAMALELEEAAYSVRQVEAELGQASAATQKYAATELQAKAALEATKAELAAARTGYLELQAATTGSARSSVEYKAASEQMRGSIQQLTAESRLQKTALKDAAQETKAAQLAENSLSAQYEKSTTTLDRVRGELQEKNAALEASRTALKATGIEASNLAQAERNLGNAVTALRQQVIGLAPAYAQVATASSASVKQQLGDQKAVSDGVASLKMQLQQIQQVAMLALGGGFAGGMLKDVSDTADAYNNLAARIKLATGEGEAFTEGFEGVQRVAVDTSSSLEGTGVLFARIVQAGKEFNLSQGDALKLTESINQAVQLSGSSAQASGAAVTQLIQGLQSGVLRGEEFNSVMEQAPRLAQAIANGLGVTTGELRKMAAAGELTAVAVVKSLQTQGQALRSEFEKMPATVGRAITNLQTQWSLFVGQLDSGTGATSYVAEGINKLADNLDTVARVATIAGTALTASLAVQGVAALRAYAAEAAVAAGSTNLLAASIQKVPKVINITVAAVGFEVGYQIGTMLYENSALARKLGIGMVGYFEVVVNSLRLAKEAAAAVFTSDTVDAAFDRYMERNRKVLMLVQSMMLDAEQAPQKVGAAVDAAATKTGKLGSAAQAVGGQVAQAGAAGAAGMGQMGKAAADTLSIFKGLLVEAQKPQPKQGAVEAIAAQLVDARKKGLDFDALLRRELPEAIGKLTGPELAKFRLEFIKAMQDAGGSGKEVQTGLRLIGEQAAKSLGVDLVAAGNQVSKVFRESDEAFRMLVLSLSALKAAGVDTGRVLGESLAKMIDSAKSNAELDLVRQRVTALRKDLGGKVADGLLDHAKQKAESLKDALDSVTPGINSVREAMKELGIASDESLKKTASTAKDAYETMAQSGIASARELGEAFRKSAEAGIAANNGIAPSWVQAQAAVRGYEVETDKAGKSTLRLADATDHVGNSHDRALRFVNDHRTALERLNDEREREIAVQERANALAERELELYRKKWNIDKEGFTLDANGNKMLATVQTQESVYNEAKGAGLTVEQSRDIADRYTSWGKSFNNNEFWKEVNQIKQQNDLMGASGAATTRTATQIQGDTAAQTAGTGTGTITRVVNMYIGDSTRSYPVPTNGAGERSLSDIAAGVLGLLEASRRSTGR